MVFFSRSNALKSILDKLGHCITFMRWSLYAHYSAVEAYAALAPNEPAVNGYLTINAY